ncbi:MAG: GTPase Era [Flavobacteriales bacterium]
MAHKSGFVNIVGNPNVGKSTFMNALLGEKLSIITSKAQTTRHRIFGIFNDEEHQIVFSDTPGIIKPSYALQENMMHFAHSTLKDADVLILMTTVKEKSLKDELFLDTIAKMNVPLLVLINKIDLSNQEELERAVSFWEEKLPSAEVYPISALEEFNTDMVLSRVKKLLDEGPAYFDKDAITDKPERFFVSEIIREKVLLNYQKEIPYSVEVVVESFKEEEDIIRIAAVLYVTRDSQKGIIIGHKGKEIKKVGSQARRDIERFLGKKVFLETFVKVSKNWRENEKQLKRFGYQQ